MTLFDTHRALLDGALAASAARTYWSPFPENASPKIYGETAQTDGQERAANQAAQRIRLDLARWFALSERAPRPPAP